MPDILPFLAIEGSLRPVSPEGEAVCLAHRGQIVRMELMTPRKLHTRQQEKFWWAVAVPTILACWRAKKGWSVLVEDADGAKRVVHDMVMRQVFGEVETPLGNARKSSTTLAIEEYSRLIDWAAVYLREEFGVELPKPEEGRW